ncbi:MAG: PrgI family protein [Clostridia bacterium]|nr:PrgI family protein [Clostridia bacterium]
MAYVPVPKDLTKVKTKFLFNLTKRQLVCFGSGALVGVPLFFLLKDPIGTSTAALIMVFVMLPFFLLAMFERNGQPLEKVARNMANVLFLRPKQRLYMTNNFYDCLARQNQLDKEVHSVIHGKKADKK